MEKTVVKLSRPLLLKNDDDKYFLCYGFIVDDGKLNGPDDPILYDYVGYLAGMHFKTAGVDYFDVSNEYWSGPWVDENGLPHFKDDWMSHMMEKCRGLLCLTYDVVQMGINEEAFADVVESNYFITSESLFDGQETLIEKKDDEQGADLSF